MNRHQCTLQEEGSTLGPILFSAFISDQLFVQMLIYRRMQMTLFSIHTRKD